MRALPAQRRSERSPSSREWLGFYVASALGVGLLAGVVAGAVTVARNDYLALDLHGIAWAVLARATRRAFLGAAALVGTAWLLRASLARFGLGVLAAPACLAGFLAATWVASRYDWTDPLWITTWELWAGGCFVTIVAMFPKRWVPSGRTPLVVGVGALLVAIGISVGSHWLDERRRSELVRAGRPNVVLLLVDALRADHVGAYGYSRPTTPTLDALAARGVRFANAVSPSNKTRTTMPSLWSGLYPSRHGVFGVQDLVPQDLTTAAELLRDRGYRTAAFCPNPNLDRSVGHAQGWDRYDDRSLQPDRSRGPKWAQFETASRIHERFLSWLDRDREAPFLAWLHYRDVHGPYVPPPPYDTLFDSETARPLTASEAERRKAYLTLPDDDDDLSFYVDRYDGEIRYTDDRIAELLAALDSRGLLERTVFLVAADHGETFLEHGFWDHGDTLHQEQLHVPLIVAGPGVAPGRVFAEPVSTLDLFPSMVALAGVSAPANDGTSLLTHFAGDPRARRAGPVFSEAANPAGVRQWAVRQGNWKLLGVWGEEGELFDLERDSLEAVDRSAEAPDIATRLRAEWLAFAGHSPLRESSSTRDGSVDPEQRKQLEALGYVEPDADP